MNVSYEKAQMPMNSDSRRSSAPPLSPARSLFLLLKVSTSIAFPIPIGLFPQAKVTDLVAPDEATPARTGMLFLSQVEL